MKRRHRFFVQTRLHAGAIGILALTFGTGIIVLPLAAQLRPAFAQTAGLSPDQLTAKKLIDDINALNDELLATLPANKFGVTLPVIDSPGQVVSVIDRLENLLTSASRHSLVQRPEAARDVVLSALQLLYQGRGNTTPRDGTGWYPSQRTGALPMPAAPAPAPASGGVMGSFMNIMGNKPAPAPVAAAPAPHSGPSGGLSEIQHILSRNLLDAKGKQDFINFVQAHDFDSASVKRAAGFPPVFQINNDSIKNSVLALANAAPTASNYQPHPSFQPAAIVAAAPPAAAPAPVPAPAAPAGAAQPANVQPANAQAPGAPGKTVSELLDDAVRARDIDSKEANALKEFLHSVGKNFYDKSIGIQNDPTKSFVKYFGRDEEVRSTVNAMSKTEKQHVLLTGKAGVGKTTILKILQDAFVSGKMQIRGDHSPIILELPITSVTNPSDPNVILKEVANAQRLSKALDRAVVLYVDEAHISTPMTRNALKGFLTDAIEAIPKSSRVHMVFSTTSAEARDFLSDSAFSRRFTQVNVGEFDRAQTLKLIKESYVDPWKRTHQKQGLHFDGISDDAYEYAYRYAATEQPHAGNPGGTKELLEAAIVRKLNDDAGKKQGHFKLEAKDIQDYIRDNLKQSLIPGDPEFDQRFQAKWAAFNDDYVGNGGVKQDWEQILHDHFGSFHRDRMTSVVNFGPPGGGKSFGAEQIAEKFFDGAMLTINGADYKEGGLALNKLQGSPVGTVGSNEQRSVLTRFLADHPGGGVIKIEEADYLHQDVIQFFTNIISEKKFTDGLGKDWDTSRYLLVMNSNKGQDLMIPKDANNKMNWEQFETRRKAITEKVIVHGGEVERVRPELLGQVFDGFVESIVKDSSPNGETSGVSQEAQKQKRRYKAIYTMPPNREDLEAAGKAKLAKFVREVKADYGVELRLDPEMLGKVLDLEAYDFEKGYSYVADQLQDKLFRYITPHLHERGKHVDVSLESTVVTLNDRELPGQKLHVNVEGKPPQTYQLGVVGTHDVNAWGDSPEMMDRIRNFGKLMSKQIKGNDLIIQDIKNLLKLKSQDWSTRPVITLLGTSGNGKTETFKAIARTLYNDPKAIFKLEGLNHEYDLNNYLRPPKGVIGSPEETEFERWVLSRKNSGGGVILLDELLSFSGLSRESVANKVTVINKLYDLLDEGFLMIGNKRVDVRGFVIGVTGNSMQEIFKGIPDDPGFEKQVTKLLARISRKDITGYLAQAGLDAPKVARLGQIHVMGPQPRAVSLSVGRQKTADLIAAIRAKKSRPPEIVIDDAAIQQVVKQLSTVELGMREVDQGMQKLVRGPLNNILADLPQTRRLELKLVPGASPGEAERVQWLADGREVALEGVPLSDTPHHAGGTIPEEQNWNFRDKFGAHSRDRTPQLSDIGAAKKLIYSEDALRAVNIHETYGHWMVDAILNRRNNAEAISLVPGEGHLGYMMPLQDEVFHIKDLTRAMREAVVLNAGHRAVFLHGKYATGGGAVEAAEKNRTDDLGRISKLFDEMINNRLIPGVSEGSSAAEKAIVKDFLGDALDHATDRIITEGVNSGKFDAVFNNLMTNRYLTKEDLDHHLHGVDFAAFGNADEYFLDRMSQGFAEAGAHMSERGQTAARVVATTAPGLTERLAHEAESRVQDPAVVSRIREVRLQAQAAASTASGRSVAEAPHLNDQKSRFNGKSTAASSDGAAACQTGWSAIGQRARQFLRR